MDQTDVVITDVVPLGTTYVSSACAAPCTSSYDAATNTVTWLVGTLTAESSVSVTFIVRIDLPAAGADGSLPATVIDNVGAIASTQTPIKPSNVVRTVVPRVLGVVVVRPPPAVRGVVRTLPRTGLAVPLSLQIPAALVLIVAGCALGFVRRDERSERSSHE